MKKLLFVLTLVFASVNIFQKHYILKIAKKQKQRDTKILKKVNLGMRDI